MIPLPARGDIWWCETGELGRRPVVVLSRDPAIRARLRVVAAHCSSVVRGIETEVLLEPGDDPIPETTAVALDSISEYPVGALTMRLGRISDARMHQVCEALKVAVGCR